MLALPAHARLCGERLFHQRRRIDENFHLSPRLGHEGAGELFQARLDEVMIVPAPRIDGDVSDSAFGQQLHRVDTRPIVQCDDDSRFRPGPHGGRGPAPVQRGFHPLHLAMATVCHESLKPFTCRPWLIGPRDADAVETYRTRRVFEESFGRTGQGIRSRDRHNGRPVAYPRSGRSATDESWGGT